MDQTKYINTYIDVAIATINETTAQLLQLKTQNRLANEALSEKDNFLATLLAERDTSTTAQLEEKDRTLAIIRQEKDNAIEALKRENEALRNASVADNDANARYEQLQQEHAGLIKKVSHMDSLLNQVSSMKQEILSRNEQISQLTNALADKDTTINKFQEDIVYRDGEIVTLNSIVTEKEDAIKKLQEELEALKNSAAKVINKKAGKKPTDGKETNTLDDF